MILKQINWCFCKSSKKSLSLDDASLTFIQISIVKFQVKSICEATEGLSCKSLINFVLPMDENHPGMFCGEMSGRHFFL